MRAFSNPVLFVALFAGIALASVYAAGGFPAAQAHEDADAKKALEDKIEVLALQVEYLRAREAALTKYVLLNEKRAAGLEEIARRSRAAGFESRSIAVDSRRILLGGIESLAVSLRKDLPALTREDELLLKKIKALQ